MNNSFDVIFLKDHVQRYPIIQIAMIQFTAKYGLLPSGGQAVYNNEFLLLFNKGGNYMASNIAGSTTNQYCHLQNPPFRRIVILIIQGYVTSRSSFIFKF
ncbi:hypothetical protein D3C73_1209760 [compost metagenome]